MKKHCFVILPYLKTSGPVSIRGISFRSNTDLASLTEPDRQHLSTIFDMFFLKDQWHITEMSYAVFEFETSEVPEEKAMRCLNEVHQILAYLYSSPHPSILDPFLYTEHANLYALFPERFFSSLLYEQAHFLVNTGSVPLYPVPDDRDEVPGYRAISNGEHIFWVAAGSRIYLASNAFGLNISQDLLADLERRFISGGRDPFALFLAGANKLGSIEERLFTALRWHNMSNSVFTDDNAALLHLAIAFESLLALDQGPHITGRFKESVRLLSGAVPKLDSWVHQFYKARSAIVHEGSSKEITFDAEAFRKKTRSDYRSLVSYGRVIFRICFNSIISGAYMANEIGLSSLLTTNQERFEKICAVLSKPGINSSDALLSLEKEIFDIDEYRFISETNLSVDTMMAVLRLAVRHLLNINPPISRDLLDLYSKLTLMASSQDHFEELEIIQQIKRYIPDHGPFSEGLPFDAISLVFSLTNSVKHYTFMHYYALKHQREKASGSP